MHIEILYLLLCIRHANTRSVGYRERKGNTIVVKGMLRDKGMSKKAMLGLYEGVIMSKMLWCRYVGP